MAYLKKITSCFAFVTFSQMDAVRESNASSRGHEKSVDLAKADKPVTSGVHDSPLKSQRHVSVMMRVLLQHRDKRKKDGVMRSVYQCTRMRVECSSSIVLLRTQDQKSSAFR